MLLRLEMSFDLFAYINRLDDGINLSTEIFTFQLETEIFTFQLENDRRTVETSLFFNVNFDSEVC